MIKAVFKYFIFVLWFCPLFAAEIITEFELYQNNPRTYYANHPAAKATSENIFIRIDDQVMLEVGSLLDRVSTGAFLASWKRFNSVRILLSVPFIPLIYETNQLKLQDAFFPLDHPQWTPDYLNPEQRWILHYHWFLTGHKIPVSADGSWSATEIENIKKKFKLLFSAACCGHKFAAEDVGSMLMDPRFNDVLPVVITFHDLEERVVNLDARRLNKPHTENQDLEEIIKQAIELSKALKNQEQAKETEGIVASLARARSILQQLSKLGQTEEVILLNLIFTTAINYLEQEKCLTGMVPTEAYVYAKSVHRRTPFIDDFINDMESRAEPMRESMMQRLVKQGPSTYSRVLNKDFISAYEQILAYEFPAPTDATGISNFYTNEIPEALQSALNIRKVRVLLGEQEDVFNDFILNTYIILYMQNRKMDFEGEKRANLFTLYLTLAREPTAKQFSIVNNGIQIILAPLGIPDADRPNAVRYQRLTERFSAKSLS